MTQGLSLIRHDAKKLKIFSHSDKINFRADNIFNAEETTFSTQENCTTVLSLHWPPHILPGEDRVWNGLEDQVWNTDNLPANLCFLKERKLIFSNIFKCISIQKAWYNMNKPRSYTEEVTVNFFSFLLYFKYVNYLQ